MRLPLEEEPPPDGRLRTGSGAPRSGAESVSPGKRPAGRAGRPLCLCVCLPLHASLSLLSLSVSPSLPPSPKGWRGPAGAGGRGPRSTGMATAALPRGARLWPRAGTALQNPLQQPCAEPQTPWDTRTGEARGPRAWGPDRAAAWGRPCQSGTHIGTVGSVLTKPPTLPASPALLSVPPASTCSCGLRPSPAGSLGQARPPAPPRRPRSPTPRGWVPCLCDCRGPHRTLPRPSAASAVSLGGGLPPRPSQEAGSPFH